MRKVIFATYDDEIIRVYQAFNKQIADEAIGLGTFSTKFKMDRMTWIKPSFLWMMDRSGWATKEGQERVLAIDISIDGFREILNSAILSSFNPKVYKSHGEWKTLLANSNIRCQWDPDKDIYGGLKDTRAIQLGLKGSAVEHYVRDWIVNITDITDYAKSIKSLIDCNQINKIVLPKVKEFFLSKEEQFKLGLAED